MEPDSKYYERESLSTWFASREIELRLTNFGAFNPNFVFRDFLPGKRHSRKLPRCLESVKHSARFRSVIFILGPPLNRIQWGSVVNRLSQSLRRRTYNRAGMFLCGLANRHQSLGDIRTAAKTSARTTLTKVMIVE